MAAKTSKGFSAALLGSLCLGLYLVSATVAADAWEEFEALRTGDSQAQGQDRSVAVGGSSRHRSIDDVADEEKTRRKAAELGFSLPSNADAHYEYRIGSHDVLEIEVFQVDELSKATRVNSGGYISVPLIGKVKVGGLTVGEAETQIADALGRDYLQDPQVSIFVKEYESQKFTVEGEVKEPGVFPIKGPTTLLQAIAMARGMDKLADSEAIVLFRTNEDTGDTAGFKVDIEKLRTGEKEDPLIANGDVIVVPRSGSKAFIDSFSNTLRGFIGFGTL